MNKLEKILLSQQNYKKQHADCNIRALKKQLVLFLDTLNKYEQEISEALFKDMHKNTIEVYLTEFVQVIHELKWFIKHLNKVHSKHNTTKLAQLYLYKNYEKRKAHGNVLIYSAYNYPFQLSLIPLIGAIACNNTVILKLSEHTPCINKVITKILSVVFESQQCYVVSHNDAAGNLYEVLYAMQVDMVFFTGSYTTGKKVYENYAKHIIPVVLELGGKSPAIIDSSCNLQQAAKRLVWAKMVNCGQTCVAPDYVVIHKPLLPKFAEYFKHEFARQYTAKNLTTDIASCPAQQILKYQELLEKQTLYWSHPLSEGLKVALVRFNSFEDPIWKEEIFGPLLPIVTYQTDDDIYSIISHNPDPLSLYIFSNNTKFINAIYNNINAGSVTVNDCVVQLNSPIPFGGVHKSGIGQYHGQASVNCFMRIQPLIKCTKIDFPARFAPTNAKKLRFLRKFVK